MKWFSKKNPGGTSHFIPDEIKRDVSDNENPVTFATPLVQEEELESFANDKKEEFENDNFFNEIIKELDGLENDNTVSHDDKMLAYYGVYQQYEKLLTPEQKKIILDGMQKIDSLRKSELKNNSISEKIKNLANKSGGFSNEENKSPRDDSRRESKPLPRQEKKIAKNTSSDDDWDERISNMMALAEFED